MKTKIKFLLFSVLFIAIAFSFFGIVRAQSENVAILIEQIKAKIAQLQIMLAQAQLEEQGAQSGSVGGGYLSWDTTSAKMTPITGDWDGNKTTGFGMFEPKTATFYLKNSLSSGPYDYIFSLDVGRADLTEDDFIPITGDWNNDGKTEVGILWRDYMPVIFKTGEKRTVMVPTADGFGMQTVTYSGGSSKIKTLDKIVFYLAYSNDDRRLDNVITVSANEILAGKSVSRIKLANGSEVAYYYRGFSGSIGGRYTAETYTLWGDWNGDGIITSGSYQGMHPIQTGIPGDMDYINGEFDLSNAGPSDRACISKIEDEHRVCENKCSADFGFMGSKNYASWKDCLAKCRIILDKESTCVTGSTIKEPTFITYYFGTPKSSINANGSFNPGGIPVSGDWDGNGKWTTGIFNPSTGTFYLLNSNRNVGSKTAFGEPDIKFQANSTQNIQNLTGMKVISGDWYGTNTDLVGLYNPATSKFYLARANITGMTGVNFVFGTPGSGWLPIAGDWDGNGSASVGLYDPTSSTFHLRNSNTSGQDDLTFILGTPKAGMLPVSGDFDADGITDVGIYDTETGQFILRYSNPSRAQSVNFEPTFSFTALYGDYLPKNGIFPLAGDWNQDVMATVGVFDSNIAQGKFWGTNSNSYGITGNVEIKKMARPEMPLYSNGWIPVSGSWYAPEVIGAGQIKPSAWQIAFFDPATSTFHFPVRAGYISSYGIADFTISIPDAYTSTSVSQTHNVCQNQKCVSVPGSGTNLCNSDESCVTPITSCSNLYWFDNSQTNDQKCKTQKQFCGSYMYLGLRTFNNQYDCFVAAESTPLVCPQDVRLCPDGSYIRRGGTNCEFMACPTTTSSGNGWLPIAGDWNGDGTDTVGLYDPKTSYFHLINSNTEGVADIAFGYGTPNAGWLPIAGDWNGDGIDTIGLYDPASSHFYLRNTNTTGYSDIDFGYGTPRAGWLPIANDWNGDGKDTVGLYDPASSHFYLRNTNTTGYSDINFGYGAAGAGWKPIAGMWVFDGRYAIGLYEPKISYFHLRKSNTEGVADITIGYGSANGGWLPIAGDWNNDRVDTIGLYDPITSHFYLRNSNTTGVSDINFGYGPTTITVVTPTRCATQGESYNPTINPEASGISGCCAGLTYVQSPSCQGLLGCGGTCVAPVIGGNKSIKVLYPNGGEIFAPGQVVTIRWESTGYSPNDQIGVTLITNNSLYETYDYPLNTGSFNWTVPSNTSGSNYKIMLSIKGATVANWEINDRSDGNFAIVSESASVDKQVAGISSSLKIIQELINKLIK